MEVLAHACSASQRLREQRGMVSEALHPWPTDMKPFSWDFKPDCTVVPKKAQSCNAIIDLTSDLGAFGANSNSLCTSPWS